MGQKAGHLTTHHGAHRAWRPIRGYGFIRDVHVADQPQCRTGRPDRAAARPYGVGEGSGQGEEQAQAEKNETSPALPFGVETSVSTKKVSDIAGLALDPSAAKTQKPLSGALTAADIAGMGLSPGTAEIQKHLSGVLTAADIARLGLDPAAHARKSLESIADPLSSSTAKGLAALLAKSAPKKQ